MSRTKVAKNPAGALEFAGKIGSAVVSTKPKAYLSKTPNVINSNWQTTLSVKICIDTKTNTVFLIKNGLPLSYIHLHLEN